LKRITQMLVAAVTAGLALYDLIPATRRGKGDTVSEVLRDAAHRYPIVAFGAGVLVWHWWWSSAQEQAVEKVVEKLESNANG
jgi:hypothetical protein